jgi:putative ABC transport system permease protein
MIIDIMIKELRRKKFRTILTILGVSIGILLVVSINSFSQGLSVMVNDQLKYLSGMVMVVDANAGLQNMASSSLDESLADEISQMSGVEEVAPMVFASVTGFGSIMGLDPEHYDMFASASVGIDEGREVDKDAYELAIGPKLAETLGLSVGDTVTLKGKEYEIVGIFKESGTEDDNGAMASLSVTQELANKEDKVTMIIVKPVDVSDLEELSREIQ